MRDNADPLQRTLLRLQQDANADLVLLGELISTPIKRIRTLCCQIDQRWQPSFSYLPDTHPCQLVLSSAAFLHLPDAPGSYPQGYVLADHGMRAYAGVPVTLPSPTDNPGEPGMGVLVLMSRTALPPPAHLRTLLQDAAQEFGAHADALSHSVSMTRLAQAEVARTAFFNTYVLNNASGVAYSEFMPPVPIDLPEEEFLHRLMYTGHIIDCNTAIASTYGYASASAMLGARPIDGYGEEKLRRNFTNWMQHNFEIRDMESQAIDAQGHVTWIKGSLFTTVHEGKVPHMWIQRKDITAEKRYDAAIHHKAHHDALTSLPNRYWFQDRIAELIKDHAARNKRLCVGLLDLNGFKEVNDTMGHAVGDQILQSVAIRLLKGIKPHGAELARLGGDEFAILMPEIADTTQAQAMANTVQALLAEPFVVEDMKLSIGGSVGLALFPDESETGEDILRLADVAMYAAKKAGHPYQWYRPEIDTHSKRRLSLLASLGPAIENEEMFLVYQPKINASDRRVSGFEALIRWRHPTMGIIPPNDFIGFAETNEVIRPMTRWVLNAAIRQGSAWLRSGRALKMAVNISVRNLLDENLASHILECLSRHAYPADMLELEVTESALMTHPAQAMHMLAVLRAHGISVAIDDFGTGYSSLSYLARLPVTTLKVDQSFVSKMLSSSSDEQIVRSVISLAHECLLSVVAEGVEDEATLLALIGMSCDTLQGYFIARPMEPDAATRWLDAYEQTLEVATKTA